MATTRHSAAIQLAEGLMEMATALYDSSLSYQTRRAAIGSGEVNAIFDEGIGAGGRPPSTTTCYVPMPIRVRARSEYVPVSIMRDLTTILRD
jgi:hypothetical protein